jgi:sRNA-binding carbon storage regulator CsrA
MLTLSRKPNETIDLFFGDELLGSITVTKVQGHKVSLGFEGQPDLIIRRREVTEAIERGDLQLHKEEPAAA